MCGGGGSVRARGGRAWERSPRGAAAGTGGGCCPEGGGMEAAVAALGVPMRGRRGGRVGWGLRGAGVPVCV